MARRYTWRFELSCLQTAMRHHDVLKVEYDWSRSTCATQESSTAESSYEAQHLKVVYPKLDYLIRCM